VGWAISRFISYLREQGAFVEPPCPPPLYQPLLEDDCTWMRRQRQTLREHAGTALPQPQRMAAAAGPADYDQGIGAAGRRSIQLNRRWFEKSLAEAPLP